MHSFFSILASLSFVFFARGAELTSRAFSGAATFYGGNLHGGACSFSTYTLPAGLLGTALSDSNWDNAGNCGACISVTGPAGNSITAMIVDECPGCGLNHLDLFPDAFQELADPVNGVIQTTWDFVDCPVSGPLQLHNKDGVSAYWFSMQVVNAVRAVKTLEVSTDGGSTWQGTTRQSYNFFEYSSGFGTTTVDVKVTSVDGDTVIIQDVEVASGSSTTASGNFGSSGSSIANPTLSSTTPETVATQAPAPSPAAASSSSTTEVPMPGNFYQSTLSTAATTSTPSADYTSTGNPIVSPAASSTAGSPSLISTSTSATSPALSTVTVTVTVPCSTSVSSTSVPPLASTTIPSTPYVNATIVVPSFTPKPSTFTGAAARTYGNIGAAIAALTCVVLVL